MAQSATISVKSKPDGLETAQRRRRDAPLETPLSDRPSGGLRRQPIIGRRSKLMLRRWQAEKQAAAIAACGAGSGAKVTMSCIDSGV